MANTIKIERRKNRTKNVLQINDVLKNFPDEYVEKIRSKCKRKRQVDKALRKRAKFIVLKAATKRKKAA